MSSGNNNYYYCINVFNNYIMNREIKFRGKNSSTKDWVYGSLISDKTGGVAIVQQLENPISNGVVSGFCLGIIKGTECQFTGLKDINGQDIYEGDTVKVDCSGVSGSLNDGVYIVEYILPDCSFSLIQLDRKSGIQFNECYTYEIIGKIHENAELL